jgi:hypothetical protein
MTPDVFRRALKIALLCASNDPERAVLCGVRIWSGRMEATDGHRLVRVLFEGALAREGFAQRKEIASYLAWLETRDGLHNDGFTGPAEALLPFDQSVQYPETHRLWAAHEKRSAPTGELFVAPEYLAELQTIWNLLAPDHRGSTQVQFGGPTEPLLFSMKHDELVVDYLLMPMRKPESALAPGFICDACGHLHQGERYAFICIGCPCSRRSKDGSLHALDLARATLADVGGGA